MTSEEQTTYRVHPLASHRVVGGEVFIVTADRAFHRLSVPTAVDAFLEIAKGTVRRAELDALIVARYRVSTQQAHEDVGAFLQSLLDKQVIVATETEDEPCG